MEAHDRHARSIEALPWSLANVEHLREIADVELSNVVAVSEVLDRNQMRFVMNLNSLFDVMFSHMATRNEMIRGVERDRIGPDGTDTIIGEPICCGRTGAT